MKAYKQTPEQTQLSSKHAAFIQSQNICPLCSTQLEIRVMSYLEDCMIREEAHCPECEVLARVKDHRMH